MRGQIAVMELSEARGIREQEDHDASEQEEGEGETTWLGRRGHRALSVAADLPKRVRSHGPSPGSLAPSTITIDDM
jgi:hypothetical protein